jgi:hypothetical protein
VARNRSWLGERTATATRTTRTRNRTQNMVPVENECIPSTNRYIEKKKRNKKGKVPGPAMSYPRSNRPTTPSASPRACPSSGSIAAAVVVAAALPVGVCSAAPRCGSIPSAGATGCGGAKVRNGDGATSERWKRARKSFACGGGGCWFGSAAAAKACPAACAASLSSTVGANVPGGGGASPSGWPSGGFPAPATCCA